jgi:hypothetical protein
MCQICAYLNNIIAPLDAARTAQRAIPAEVSKYLRAAQE